MASIVSAGTTSATALNMSADTTGILQLASNNGTVALTIDTSQTINLGATSNVFGSKFGITSSSAFPFASITSAVAGSVFQKSTTGAGNQIMFLSSNSFNYGVIGVVSAGGTATTDVYSIGYVASAGGTPTSVMTWNSNQGKVSIGGNSPTSNFQFEVVNTYDTGASRASKLNTVSLGQSGGDYPFVGYNFRATNTSLTYNYDGLDTYFAHSYGNNARLAVYSASAGAAGTAISLSLGPYVVTNGTSWTTGSDERIKNITGTLTGALDSISQLRAVRYTLKDDPRNKSQIGFIAQDWQKDYPEVVDVPEHEVDPKTGDKLYLGIQYTETIPVLLAAIQELNAKVTSLEEQVLNLGVK
jgi:hypothetical protein